MPACVDWASFCHNSKRIRDSTHGRWHMQAEYCLTRKKYAIMELETLTVVWAMSHFYCYLYGYDVMVLTDPLSS